MRKVQEAERECLERLRAKHQVKTYESAPKPRLVARKTMRWVSVKPMNGMNETMVVGLSSR